MTAREAIARLRREGWRGRTVVSDHKGDIPMPTPRAICKQAGWEYPPKR